MPNGPIWYHTYISQNQEENKIFYEKNRNEVVFSRILLVSIMETSLLSTRQGEKMNKLLLGLGLVGSCLMLPSCLTVNPEVILKQNSSIICDLVTQEFPIAEHYCNSLVD